MSCTVQGVPRLGYHCKRIAGALSGVYLPKAYLFSPTSASPNNLVVLTVLTVRPLRRKPRPAKPQASSQLRFAVHELLVSEIVGVDILLLHFADGGTTEAGEPNAEATCTGREKTHARNQYKETHARNSMTQENRAESQISCTVLILRITHLSAQHSTVRTVKYSTVYWSTIHYSTVQHRTVQ